MSYSHRQLEPSLERFSEGLVMLNSEFDSLAYFLEEFQCNSLEIILCNPVPQF